MLNMVVDVNSGHIHRQRLACPMPHTVHIHSGEEDQNSEVTGYRSHAHDILFNLVRLNGSLESESSL